MSDKPELLAWVGEDEMGSGKIGIKQAFVPAGMIPIVAVAEDHEKITTAQIIEQFQLQADRYGKTICLVQYIPDKELIVIKPRGKG